MAMVYRQSPYSAGRRCKNFSVEPLLPERLGIGPIAAAIRGGPRRGTITATIRPDFAAAMAVGDRAQKNGHDFLYRLRRDERVRALAQVIVPATGTAGRSRHRAIEVRDPTATSTGLVLVRRAATAVSCRRHRPLADPPRHVGAASGKSLPRSASSGLQAADWYEARQSARRAGASGRRTFAVRPGGPGHRP